MDPNFARTLSGPLGLETYFTAVRRVETRFLRKVAVTLLHFTRSGANYCPQSVPYGESCLATAFIGQELKFKSPFSVPSFTFVYMFCEHAVRIDGDEQTAAAGQNLSSLIDDLGGVDVTAS
jgi:hypothetical protein